MKNEQEDGVYALKFAIMQKQIDKLKEEVEQKDKQIDLMTERAFLTEDEWNEIQEKYIYDVMNNDTNEYIKQYFGNYERKAREIKEQNDRGYVLKCVVIQQKINIDKLNKEIERKNKIIDLMARGLALHCETNCAEDIKTNKEQIKQHFENQVKY